MLFDFFFRVVLKKGDGCSKHISHKPLNFTYGNQTLKLNTLSRPNKEFTRGIQPAAGGTQPSEAPQPLRALRTPCPDQRSSTAAGTASHPACPRAPNASGHRLPISSYSHPSAPRSASPPQPEQRPNGRTARARCPLNGRLPPPPRAVPEPRAAPAGAARPL